MKEAVSLFKKLTGKAKERNEPDNEGRGSNPKKHSVLRKPEGSFLSVCSAYAGAQQPALTLGQKEFLIYLRDAFQHRCELARQNLEHECEHGSIESLRQAIDEAVALGIPEQDLHR